MPSSAQGMTAKSWQPYWPILAPLLIRTFQLALPQTHFQPDEFYQSLEPPHWLVFGYGHLTWEWRDLPGSAGAAAAAGLGGPGVEGVRWGMDDWSGWGARWYEEIVVRGRMRGWIWPGVFVGVYKALQVLGREDLVAIAPRLIGVLVAAMTDYGTYRLASKLLGPGAGPTALFLSLNSLFNAHALPRLLSTSPETLLVVWALVYFPLPPPDAPRRVVVGKEKIVVAGDMKQVRHAEDTDGAKVEERAQEGADVKRVGKVGDYDYTMMDRIAHPEQAGPESIIVATTLATLAICIRPTTLPFWAFLGTDYAIRRHSFRGMASAILAAICTLAFSTYIDYTLTGRLVFPVLTFAHYNLFNPIAAFYGATDITYHLVQTIPILTFPFILPFLRGFLANMLPPQLHAWGLDKYDRPAGLRIVSRASAFAIAALSLSTHSEWRFLHPFLPIFVVLMISPLSVAYTPTIIGAYRLTDCMRQYVRMSKLHYYGALLGLLPYLYLTMHGRAQAEVVNALRRGEVGEVRGIVALMPCHSTPWQSHLHMDVPGWFLTCEPPIGMDREKHITQQQVFYADPEAYMQNTFPSPPLSDGKWLEPPSHVLLFGHILAFIGEELAEKGYEEVWYAWNGFDILQDEVERRGSVRVWRLQDQAQTA